MPYLVVHVFLVAGPPQVFNTVVAMTTVIVSDLHFIGGRVAKKGKRNKSMDSKCPSPLINV
jgi:hypothetical protein